MLPAENSYGVNKRLNFLIEIIERFRPETVLDVGCGSGANVTVPLAAHFPKIRFLGVDSDESSIQYAQQSKSLPNLAFEQPDHLAQLGRYDLVIASEVIEHVEDPHSFLEIMRARLTDRGKMILTLPNGYGPFEFMSLMEVLLHLSGLHASLRRAKRFFTDTADGDVQPVDTFAISPHINFFSYRQIVRLLESNGLPVLEYRPRTFLCGFGFDQILSRQNLLSWNNRIADRLPPYVNSAWMFLLGQGEKRQNAAYKRSAYARLRRYLNEKRWRLA